jgi:hypothetical protein
MAILETLAALGTALLPAVGRSVVGWLEKVISDVSDGGVAITKWEWMELGKTLVRVGFYTALVYFGLDAYTGDADALGAGVAGVVIDLILRAMKTSEPKPSTLTKL